jgi:hypothetical protein
MLIPPGLREIEAACGMPFGSTGALLPADSVGVMEALVRDLEPAAAQGPLVVWISGDDGTAVVAAAAIEAARRAGAGRPAAVTPLFGDDPMDPYAERVVRALGLEDWERPEVSSEHGLLGAVTQGYLSSYGPMFPSIACVFVPMLAVARGGTLVAGHSLHEGWYLSRPAQVARMLADVHARRRLEKGDLRALVAIAPLPVRRRLSATLARALDVPYLKPEARATARRLAVDDVITGPFHAGRSGQRAVARACVPTALSIYDRLAADQGASFHFAWGSPRVGAALANDLGRLGPPSPDAFRRRFVPWLPERDAPHAPPRFRWVWRNPETERFIEEWDGTGLDEGLVDARELRAAWRRADWRSGILLQSAWLASRRSQEQRLSVGSP